MQQNNCQTIIYYFPSSNSEITYTYMIMFKSFYNFLNDDDNNNTYEYNVCSNE